MHLLVLDHHDSFVHNILQLLREQEGVSFDLYTSLPELSIDLSPYHGLLLSPGPRIPAAYPTTQRLLREAIARGLPVLGICLGHQAIAEHFGATLYQLPAPLHGHASELIVCQPQDSVVGGLPPQRLIGRYHSWAVALESLPPCLEPTAYSEEPTEGRVLMALRHRELPLWGLQFHPESMITQDGKHYITGFLQQLRHTHQPISPTCTSATSSDTLPSKPV